ncbi:MAG: acyltransferase [Gammaproteobacteria bacterium]|nr:acyltransferase [Gammaproteobacteria bacterium]MBU1724757.1 acyltransferase [Gammaproteobacteria bacterium]MBU2005764.1 acyltransferase [Gammaproteobacteria bacterium]
MNISQLEFSPVFASVYAVSIYGFMLVLAMLLVRLNVFGRALTVPSGRYGSLDGLRGLLATGVFIHHTFVMNTYFTQGEWEWSSSAVFNQLGQSTVALFFMITGFLFTLKALNPKIDWKLLYASRLLRLLPLYAVVVVIVFGVVFYLSAGVMRESPWEIIKEFLIWISFVCFGRPDVNGYPMTWTLIANVNWSLKYEVIFYVFAVPFIHLIARFVSVRSGLLISLGLIAMVLLFRWYRGGEGGISLYTVQFLGGVMVAYAYKMESIRLNVIEGRLIRWFAVAATASLFFMQYAYGAAAIVGNIIMFAAVAGGASLFGLFKAKSAIWLGDISYGIYLLHGLVLWIVLGALARAGILAHLDLFEYWLVVLGVTAVVVLLASASYTLMEKPLMGLLSAKKRAMRQQPQDSLAYGRGGTLVPDAVSR